LLQVEVLGPVGALLPAVASEPVGALELEQAWEQSATPLKKMKQLASTIRDI